MPNITPGLDRCNHNLQIILMNLVVGLCYVAMTLPYPVFIPLLIKSAPSQHSFLNALPLFGLIIGAYPLGQFIGAPIFGYLSDQVGRKKILLFTLLGAVVFQSLSALFISYHSFIFLIITRFFSGLCEGNIAIARAVISRLATNTIERQRGFGQINAVMTLGWVIGPLLGALTSNNAIVPWFNYTTPFLVGAIVSLLTFLLVFVYFSDTVEHLQHRLKLLGFLRELLKPTCLKYNFLNPKLSNLLVMSFLLTFGIDCFYQFLPVLLSARFNATPNHLAYAVAIIAIFNALTNGFLISRLTKFCSIQKTIGITATMLIISMLIITSSRSEYEIFLLLPLIGICIGISPTNILVLLAQSVKEESQGKIMGIALSLRTLGISLICITLGNIGLRYCQLPFVLASIMMGLSLAIYLFSCLPNLQKIVTPSS